MAYILLNKRPVVETSELDSIKEDINNLASRAMLSFDTLPVTPYGSNYNVTDGQIAYNTNNNTFYKASIAYSTAIPLEMQKVVEDKCDIFLYSTLPESIKVFYSNYFEKYYNYNTLDEVNISNPEALTPVMDHKTIIKYDSNNLPYVCPVFVDSTSMLEVYYYTPMHNYYYVSDGTLFNGSVSNLYTVNEQVYEVHSYEYYTDNDIICFKYNNILYDTPFNEYNATDPQPQMENVMHNGYPLYQINDVTVYYDNGQYIQVEDNNVYIDTGASITWSACDLVAPNVTATTKLKSPAAEIEDIQQSMLSIHSDSAGLKELTTGVVTASGTYNFSSVTATDATLSNVEAHGLSVYSGVFNKFKADIADVLTGVFNSVSATYISADSLEYSGNELSTLLSGKMDASLKGVANGVAELDANGRVPYAQLPEAALTYEGNWDASTNTPALTDGTGTQGMYYDVSVGGTQDLGSGDITFFAGDTITYNGSTWNRKPGGTVYSVNNKTGHVTLDSSDIKNYSGEVIILLDSSDNVVGYAQSDNIGSIVYSDSALLTVIGKITSANTITKISDSTTITYDGTSITTSNTTINDKLQNLDYTAANGVHSVNSKIGNVKLNSGDIPDAISGYIGRITADGSYYYVNFSSNTAFLAALDAAKQVAIYSDTDLLTCVGKGKKSGVQYFIEFFNGSADAQITAYNFSIVAPNTTINDKVQATDINSSRASTATPVFMSITDYNNITPDPNTIYILYP